MINNIGLRKASVENFYLIATMDQFSTAWMKLESNRMENFNLLFLLFVEQALNMNGLEIKSNLKDKLLRNWLITSNALKC